MKKNIIIFSGSQFIDILGATRTVDVNLAKSLSKIGYAVTLISCGKIEIQNVDFIEITYVDKLNFASRILHNIGFKKVDVIQPYWHTPYRRFISDHFYFALNVLTKRFYNHAFWGSSMSIIAEK